MTKLYTRLWTVKYPDGYLSAFDCLAISAHDARKKAERRFRKKWRTLKKDGCECVRVIFKEVKPEGE